MTGRRSVRLLLPFTTDRDAFTTAGTARVYRAGLSCTGGGLLELSPVFSRARAAVRCIRGPESLERRLRVSAVPYAVVFARSRMVQ